MRRTRISRTCETRRRWLSYWNDVRLLFARVKGAKPVVVHVEPDLWGYLEQAGATDLGVGVRAAVGRAARPARAERDPRLPHERLGDEARHRLREAVGRDRARVRGAVGGVLPFAARALRHRVRGLLRSRRRVLREINGNPKTWFTPADFRRHLLYAQTFVRLAGVRMVAWQIPLGNTLMRAENNTWDHFQDNRVQWLLGAGLARSSRAYVAAGFAGFLFGARRRRQHVRVRRGEGRRHEPGADQRQHSPVAVGRRRRRLLQGAGAELLQSGRATAAAMSSFVVTCLGDSITEGSPYWDSRRAAGNPMGQWQHWATVRFRSSSFAITASGASARTRSQTDSTRQRPEPTRSCCRAGSTTSRRDARSRGGARLEALVARGSSSASRSRSATCCRGTTAGPDGGGDPRAERAHRAASAFRCCRSTTRSRTRSSRAHEGGVDACRRRPPVARRLSPAR